MVRGLAFAFVLACNNSPKLRVGERDVRPPASATIEGPDSEYGRVKRYKAFPLAPVLNDALPGWRDQELLFSATDGYTVVISGKEVEEGGAHVAVDDLDVPGFEPVGHKRVNPGPFYLVWKSGEHARPYQLASVQVAPKYTHIDGGEDTKKGQTLFKQRCIRCHAINRDGGRVGPELNVPMNVTEYWSDAQIKAYVRDPATFRYGNMPAHPDLTDADLDALVAYLHAMRSRKQMQ